MNRLLIALALGLLANTGMALGPHELLVLANRNSSNSMEIARDYAALRHVPDVNVVELDLPAPAGSDMTPDEFTKQIWEPAWKATKARGLEDHILAWAYSVDFPTRISTAPPISIQGLTFLRNQIPPRESVEKALYASPLFAGSSPGNPNLIGFPAQSFDVQRAWLGKTMPLPSMMLGVMGPNGNTREEIMECLQRGVRADGARPEGTVYFVTNSDVRSLCRTWEFAPAVRELQSHDIEAVITNALPDDTAKILGLTMGTAVVDLRGGHRFRPGAMAEHLTSMGAMFDAEGQTKITAWIRAGATASAGTVTEPYSMWEKFPHARFYAHQVAGCTLMESFFQSIRCPLQILLIGEPLAAPWSPASTLALRGLDTDVLQGKATVEVVVSTRRGEVFNRFMFLLDGRTLQPMGTSQSITLNAASLTPGDHRLRGVAYAVGSVHGEVFAEKKFKVAGP